MELTKSVYRASAFSCIRSPETFPLVLSCGIVIQGIVFAVAQSTGLRGMLVLGCTITSQMMLPGRPTGNRTHGYMAYRQTTNHSTL